MSKVDVLDHLGPVANLTFPLLFLVKSSLYFCLNSAPRYWTRTSVAWSPPMSRSFEARTEY